MKIVRFRHKDTLQYGLLEEDQVIPAKGDPFAGLEPGTSRLGLEEVQLAPPIDPPNIYAIGRNYREHAAEGGFEAPEKPIIFLKATTSIIGPGENIEIPVMLPESVDYEGELVVVIGKKAKHVSEEDALGIVLGYTCGNDVSCRKAQRGDNQWTRGKSFDTFCPLGPVIRTDLDPSNLDIKTRLNGETMQDSNTSNMIFDCKKLISYLSRAFTLLPGTVIMTGTPEGVGYPRTPPVFLKENDVIEVEIEGIGVLPNPVINEKP